MRAYISILSKVTGTRGHIQNPHISLRFSIGFKHEINSTEWRTGLYRLGGCKRKKEEKKTPRRSKKKLLIYLYAMRGGNSEVCVADYSTCGLHWSSTFIFPFVIWASIHYSLPLAAEQKDYCPAAAAFRRPIDPCLILLFLHVTLTIELLVRLMVEEGGT